MVFGQWLNRHKTGYSRHVYKIAVLAFDSVMDSGLALTLDSIATANRLAAAKRQDLRFTTTLVSPGRKRIRTGMGATFAVSSDVRIHQYDALVIPGLGLSTENEVEAFFESRSGRAAVEWLRKAGPRCPLVGASCSAVFLLAEAGLLANKVATTTWWLGSVFRDRYPGVELDETRMFVENEGVLCAGAALAQIDLMLHLIARAASPDLSRDVARFLAIDRRPSQARYMMLSAVAGIGKDVSDIERWIRKNCSRSFTIAEMAKAVGMSARTLDRRVRLATGGGASRLVQRLRVERATHLIETTKLGLDEISEKVGYSDATTLRRLLRRHLDQNPSELRRHGL
ncbi:MAG: transcriptional regulator GlxA family with amidase domain [Hyphomicrobiaceae bacterium]|jgi:transcriptional regulator GlxA family with amidase domain